MCLKDADGMADSEDPDQTYPKSMSQQSDLGLHCLLWPCYPNLCYNKTCNKKVHVSQMLLNDIRRRENSRTVTLFTCAAVVAL